MEHNNSNCQFSGVCHNCKQQINGCESACLAMEHLYHVHCFLCCFCGNQLIGQIFYNVNGKIYCEQDYKNLGFSPNYCDICGKIIELKIIQALGRSYHPSCFRCSVCQTELDGIPFTGDQENRIYCIPDYHRKFLPTCAVCKKLIAPTKGSKEILRVVSMEKDFHVDCFRCEDCGIQLSNKRPCYPQDDHILCRKCNGKRTPISRSLQVTPVNSPCDSPNVTPRCLPRGRPRILRSKRE
ncbi:Wilms tumor protein 1-interacting protein homolog isoform X1 [Pocillopora verrucosa]|uniref:Wilms tumor protein 1-interacting protein homolog isoform X1 n=2 Tax=Pocillopora verrucosa TaxID=203993 RepID=UPI002796F144|nr:Wilms tumor protein 1-interacting protein homolog isoform X1 [Pocillopora verrucosa]